MSKVRWGLLSTARINGRLIPAIRASERGELVAVASRDQVSADTYAAEWNIPRAYGSYQAMLDGDAIDAVYVSLPNHLHAAWSLRALRAGKHVLCEKPFALSLAEVDAVAAAAHETGRVVTEAFMYRHHAQTRLIGEWVRQGRLGEIRLVTGVFNFPLTDPANVRLTPDFGGGCLWDVGVYPLSLAQFIFGRPPEQVTAMQTTGASGVDEAFVGQLHYPGGGLAQIAASFRTPFYTRATIVGSAGRLEIDRPFVGIGDEGDAGVIFTDADGRRQAAATPYTPLYAGEVADMHAAILDGTPPYLTLAETRNHVRTALALYAAARSGSVVTLDKEV